MTALLPASVIRVVGGAWCSVGLLAGCGTGGVSGGTPGVLKIEGQPVPEIQLKVYSGPVDSLEFRGFAVTQPDGHFGWLLPEARGPLWLPSGEYRVTVESIGPPIKLPSTYRDAKLTPLVVHWDDSQPTWNLDIP